MEKKCRAHSSGIEMRFYAVGGQGGVDWSWSIKLHEVVRIFIHSTSEYRKRNKEPKKIHERGKYNTKVCV